MYDDNKVVQLPDRAFASPSLMTSSIDRPFCGYFGLERVSVVPEQQGFDCKVDDMTKAAYSTLLSVKAESPAYLLHCRVII